MAVELNRFFLGSLVCSIIVFLSNNVNSVMMIESFLLGNIVIIGLAVNYFMALFSIQDNACVQLIDTQQEQGVLPGK